MVNRMGEVKMIKKSTPEHELVRILEKQMNVFREITSKLPKLEQ